MNFTIIFFLISSIIALVYIIFTIKSGLRLPVIIEIFFLLIFSFVIFIVLFPKTLGFLEIKLGVPSALNFIIYTSIFLSYVFLFLLYKKTEIQRVEITKLVREISFLEKDIRDLKKNKRKK